MQQSLSTKAYITLRISKLSFFVTMSEPMSLGLDKS